MDKTFDWGFCSHAATIIFKKTEFFIRCIEASTNHKQKYLSPSFILLSALSCSALYCVCGVGVELVRQGFVIVTFYSRAEKKKLQVP